MKLGEYLAEARKRRLPPVSRKIKLRVLVPLDDPPNTHNVREAEAILVLVSDEARNEAVAEADKALAESKDPVSAGARADLQDYYFLHRALRDPSAPAEPFADTPQDLRMAFVAKQKADVVAAYQGFVEEEFPDAPTKEGLDKMTREAEGK